MRRACRGNGKAKRKPGLAGCWPGLFVAFGAYLLLLFLEVPLLEFVEGLSLLELFCMLLLESENICPLLWRAVSLISFPCPPLLLLPSDGILFSTELLLDELSDFLLAVVPFSAWPADEVPALSVVELDCCFMLSAVFAELFCLVVAVRPFLLLSVSAAAVITFCWAGEALTPANAYALAVTNRHMATAIAPNKAFFIFLSMID